MQTDKGMGGKEGRGVKLSMEGKQDEGAEACTKDHGGQKGGGRNWTQTTVDWGKGPGQHNRPHRMDRRSSGSTKDHGVQEEVDTVMESDKGKQDVGAGTGAER